VPSAARFSVVGALSDPGMCPALGSIGSTSPRKRSPARVEEDALERRRLLDADRRQSADLQRHGPWHGDDVVLGEGEPGGGPCGQRAVEESYVGHARPAQQPPGAGGGQIALPVVDDDRVAVVDAPAPRTRLQRLAGGQRMPALGRVGAAVRGELRVEVDVDGSGDVPAQVLVVTGGPAQLPPHVEDDGRAVGGEGGSELGGTDQDVHHAPVWQGPR
jgi:hypothetical protein